jgi:hypothetical protein
MSEPGSGLSRHERKPWLVYSDRQPWLSLQFVRIRADIPIFNPPVLAMFSIAKDLRRIREIFEMQPPP